MYIFLTIHDKSTDSYHFSLLIQQVCVPCMSLSLCHLSLSSSFFVVNSRLSISVLSSSCLSSCSVVSLTDKTSSASCTVSLSLSLFLCLFYFCSYFTLGFLLLIFSVLLPTSWTGGGGDTL